MTETQQRFLRSIAERVPLEHVVELHLFPPMRQGGVETGVAVVAEDPRRPLFSPASDASDTSMPSGDESSGEDSSGARQVVAAADGDVTEPDFAVAEIPTADAAVESGDAAAVLPPGLPPSDEVAIGQADGAPDSESNGATNGPHVAARYTIHTARYRLTLKGVDRGKWEVDVVAEADAPLDALDAVVRGVQRRAGEGAEPDRLSTEALREALELTPAQLDR
jgi:hypothetical protein